MDVSRDERRREAIDRYRISLPTLLTLFGGRVAFRVTLLAANVVLLARWRGDYAMVATALGTSAFLISLSSLGLEQAALRLAPRRLDQAQRFVGGVLLLAALLTVLCFVLVMSRSAVSTGDLVLPAGLYSVLLGQNQVLAGLSRALTRTAGDALNHGLLSGSVLGLLVAVVAFDLTPAIYLWGLVGTVVAADLALLISLRDAVRSRPDRSIVKQAFSTAARMAVGDVVPGLAISGVYFVLSWAGRGDESSALYLTLTASALTLGAFGYLLRIYQPQVVLTLGDGALPDLHDRVRAITRRLVLLGSPYLLATIALAWLAVGDKSLSLQGIGALALFIANGPTFIVMGSVDYVMENAAERDLDHTAVASLASLLPTAALAAVTIPAIGVIGAVAVLVALEIAHAQALLFRLSSTGRPSVGRLTP